MLKGDPPRTCHRCAALLPRRKDGKPHRNRRWCSRKCETAWRRQHVWAFARDAAIGRDEGMCVRRDVHARPADVEHLDYFEQRRLIGARGIEVNHIEPRRGEGYAAGCHNHLENLETLCHDCHVEVTTAQRYGFASSARELPTQLELVTVENGTFS